MIVEAHSEELPMTPDMRVLVAESGRYEWLGFIVGGLLMAGALYRGLVGDVGLAIVAGGAGVLTIAGTTLIRRGRRRTLAATTFTRATGRLALNYGTEGGPYEFVVGRGAVVSIDERDYRALTPLIAQAKSADFSTSADVLFEVRDAGGRVLWRHRKLR